jgi:DNA-binding NtrC family response regulator
MLGEHPYRRIIYPVLALALVFALSALVSGAFDMQTTGMELAKKTNGWVVKKIHRDSPAGHAGVLPGDYLLDFNGRSIQDWYKLYNNELTRYVTARKALHGQEVSIRVERGGKPVDLKIQLRTLSVYELVWLYGAQLFLVVSLGVLVVFIGTASPKDPRAFIAAIAFSVLIAWVGTDTPMWPGFMSSMIPQYSLAGFLSRELGFSFFLQIVISLIVHTVLIFPSRWLPAVAIRWLIPWVYLVPVGATFSYMLALPTPLADHLVSMDVFRLRFDTLLLVLICGLILTGYYRQHSPMEKAQARWIVRALFTVILIHLVFWNLPKLILGEPLVGHYSWMWLSLLLVPLALTYSIANHRIFGIRGLISRRIAALDFKLVRERQAIERRDDRIAMLTNEIQQLKDELKAYEIAGAVQAAVESTSESLDLLEREYPPVKKIRAGELIGVSEKWAGVYRDAILAAKGDDPVMIIGESGTGKTALASTIHQLSSRATGPYRQISCAQFEHADPAFALGKLFGIGVSHGLPNVPKEGQAGLLEACDGGTLFLDDFDRLPLNVQDLLLYPLEGKPFEPGVGTGNPRTVSVKFILATNRDPGTLVKKGHFQADVLARMGARVTIPPLRDRPEDIPLLVDHFLQRLTYEFEHPVDTVAPQTMALLTKYPFRQGNARELYTELRKAAGIASFSKDNVLRPEYLSAEVRGSENAEASGSPNQDTQPGSSGEDATVPRELLVLRKHEFAIKPSEDELGYSHKSKTLTHYLRGLCLKCLAENEWDVVRAAQSLAGNEEKNITARLERKLQRVLDTVSDRVKEGSEKRLYANLPVAYHQYLAEAIQRAGLLSGNK